MPPAVPCVSECSSLATGTPAFVVVGRCSAAVMTKSPRLLVTVLELGLGGDGGQLLDGDGQFRVLVRLDSVRLGGERSQQVPVAAHVVQQGCDVAVVRRADAGGFERGRWRSGLGAAVGALVLTSGGAAQAAQELHPSTKAHLQAAM